MSDARHISIVGAMPGDQAGHACRPTLQRISSETQVTTGTLLVRFDFDRQWLTVGFRPWFDWHVDTAQAAVSPGLVLFLEPGGCAVGLKAFGQTATGIGSDLLQHGGAA